MLELYYIAFLLEKGYLYFFLVILMNVSNSRVYFKGQNGHTFVIDTFTVLFAIFTSLDMDN